MSIKFGHVLLVRLDRIGDLVLTLPVDESLRKIDPHAEMQWWIPKGLGFVSAAASPRRDVREIDVRWNWIRFRALLADLKLHRPRMAIVFHAPWWISLLLFLAKVPVRAGPRSQWHQYLFFNRRIRQKRSDAKYHELEYNFQLTEGALRLGRGWLPRAHLHLQAPTNDDLHRFGLEKQGYVVVHPGMGGSALNWPLPMYAQLISKLTEDTRVVITGTRSDEPYLKPIRDMLGDNPRVTWLDGILKGQELIMILQNAKAVVAPSTGVLHLAASAGAPTVGLFSPVHVQSATRWGPRGECVTTLSPNVKCPAKFKCLGQRCPHFDCMQRVTVDSVTHAIESLLSSQAVL
ncbi:MAG: glycosyltransferase family 9 protein [Bdellovibrionaceae bacterium]|nr:glycosyltransferase family 9 protein [Pseudobdellovibrionaceae bacterium]